MSTHELTPRECEVLDLARRGLSNEAIALQLGISRNAVRYHLKELHSKLDTGGDRKRLSAWRKLRGLLPGVPVVTGVGSAKLVVGVAMGAFAIAGAAAAFTFTAADGPEGPGQAVAIDGRYPNGCPDRYSTWQATTLEEFATEYRDTLGTYAELRGLNPELVDRRLPAGTEVLVVYNPEGTCGELQETPAGAPAGPGGTPSAVLPSWASGLQMTPSDATASTGGTPQAERSDR